MFLSTYVQVRFDENTPLGAFVDHDLAPSGIGDPVRGNHVADRGGDNRAFCVASGARAPLASILDRLDTFSVDKHVRKRSGSATPVFQRSK